MASILNDKEINGLLGSVIIDGDSSCIRPNTYVLRLGSSGEFLNTGKEFELGAKKKGIRINPGDSAAVTAFETLDFRRETVHKIFPGCDLHALVSPTTDLSREGIVAPSTQVDAGYHGTLNWTLTNTSSEQRRFVFQERIYRVTFFKLGKGETPEALYSGEYQSQVGYIRSQRKGAPVGMKDADWEDSQTKGGPEEMLENLIRSGYPWNILGNRLKIIDQQFQTVTDEYDGILESINGLQTDVTAIREGQGNASDTVRKVLREETDSLLNRWLVMTFTAIVAFAGLLVTVFSNAAALEFAKQQIVWIGPSLMLIGIIGYFLIFRKKR